MKPEPEANNPQRESALPSATGYAPVDQRISHRIMLYAAQRAPGMMNQFTIEDIIKEEMAKAHNTD